MTEKPIDLEKMQDAYDDRVLRSHLEHFFGQWAPEHPALREQFHTDFHMLIARVYIEAQKPFLKTLSASLARQPFPLRPVDFGDSSQ